MPLFWIGLTVLSAIFLVVAIMIGILRTDNLRDFTSLSPEEEARFAVFEGQTRSHSNSALKVGYGIGAAICLITVIIVAAFWGPLPAMGVGGEAPAETPPAETTPAPAPAPAPAPTETAPAPAPTEGAAPAPAGGAAAPAAPAPAAPAPATN